MATLEDLLIRIGIDSKKAKSGAAGLKKDLGKAWKGMQAGAAVAGAAIGGAVVTGMQSMIESSKPVALLQAQLGATGSVAEDMGRAAGDLYNRGVVDSMETAAGTIRAIWQNQLLPEGAIKKDVDRVAGHLSTLSMISEEEAGKVSNAVKQMMRNGLVRNADEAMDLLVRGVQSGVNKAGDLFDTFNEYGTQFRKMGLSGADSMGLMNQAIRAGARDADTAADAIKEFSIRAIDGSKLSTKAFQSLGMDAKGMAHDLAAGGDTARDAFGLVLTELKKVEDPVKRNAIAVGLFGTKAEDLGDALFAMDLDTAAKGLGDVAGAADKAGQTLEQSAGAKLESFKRKALAGLTEELAKLLPAVEAVFGWIQRNQAWVKPLAVVIGILAVAIGIATAATWAWNAALMVNPITWIILAIVALVAVIVYLATKTRFFQTIWEGLWGFMKAVGRWFAGPFAGFFVTLWNKIVASLQRAKQQFMTAINFIKNIVLGWYRFQVSVITGIINYFIKVVNYVRSIPGKIRGALSSMWDGMKSGFRSAINWVISKWNSLHFTIPSFSILGKSFGGGTIGVPNIPHLADGGVVQARPGGTLVRMAEAGEDEVAAPISKLPDLGGKEPTVIVLQADDSRASRMLLELLRTAVKDRGGDVQVVVGQRKAKVT